MRLARPIPDSIVRYLLVAAVLAASFYSFLLASANWLFRQDTAASVPAAAKLVPYNSAYLARFAAWKSDEKIALLHRAVALNPFDFESLIQLGLNSEFQQRDASAAERYYLKAVEVNKMFLPKWTLTNFYFRLDRKAEFFRWASATLAITPYAPEPVFVQMWLMSQDAAEIAKAIPDRPRILLPYAWFLSNSHQYALIAPIVQRLIERVGRRNPWAWGRDDLIAAIEDRLVAEGYRDQALSIWKSMAKAGWIAKDVPSVRRPITNGEFKTIFFRHGYDWIPGNADCARAEQIAAQGELHLQFSGNQPENCIALQQYIPLQPGRIYRLQWEAQSQGTDKPSGLTWHLRGAGKAGLFETVSADLLASRPEVWIFHSPPNAEVGVLTLEYARPLGQLRAKDTVTLKSVFSSVS
ncbi:MAG: hypothetical protein M3Y24_12590 [Acidobacteriota bacterium]|nr:hypothetical protein [Acidobacteriota bacterium]